MDKIAKNAIHDLVLNLRHVLEAEIARELGRLGIYTERQWIPMEELPRLPDEHLAREDVVGVQWYSPSILFYLILPCVAITSSRERPDHPALRRGLDSEVEHRYT